MNALKGKDEVYKVGSEHWRFIIIAKVKMSTAKEVLEAQQMHTEEAACFN